MDPREADTLAALCILVMEEMGEKWGCLGVEGTREESLHGFFKKNVLLLQSFYSTRWRTGAAHARKTFRK